MAAVLAVCAVALCCCCCAARAPRPGLYGIERRLTDLDTLIDAIQTDIEYEGCPAVEVREFLSLLHTRRADRWVAFVRKLRRRRERGANIARLF